MVTIAKDANANSVVSSPGWTNPTNAYADDGTVAAFSGANGVTWSNDYGFPDFTTSDIPDGSTIDAVRMIANVWQSNAARGICGVQGRDNGANSGSEATSTSTSTSNLCTATLSGVTLTDLRSASTLLKARVRCTRSASQAFTASLDYVYIEVDFTPPTQTISAPTGIATAEAVGTPGSLTSQATINEDTDGIASAEAVGTPEVAEAAPTPQTIDTPTAIDTAEALGTPSALAIAYVLADTIASEEAEGSPALVPGVATIETPSGIVSEETFGDNVPVGHNYIELS